MKKIFITLSILFLAAGCSKTSAPTQTPPVGQNQQGSLTAPPSTATSTPGKTSTPPKVTLEVYSNAAQHYKFVYLNYFTFYTASQVKANKTSGVNFSACVPYGLKPDGCFVLNNQPYANTNLESAGVAVTVLKNKTDIGSCGTFTPEELNGGKMLSPIQINNVVFVTAVSSDAGAGNFSDTHYNRAFYGNLCYEIDETARWANAENFDPPRPEFNTSDVWTKLDVLRNGFQFVK
jgi:hypothetical protein